MSDPTSVKQLIAESDSLAAFLEAAAQHDVSSDAQAEALRRHVWGEAVPAERAKAILRRERERRDESDRGSPSASAQAPRYMDLDDLELVSGYEFAHLLAATLRRVGGGATVTTASGERGVDVVWERADETVGIRAKANDVTDPVGSDAVRAVQTAVTAADSDYSIDVPAVVTTAQYTAGAETAAAESGVRLYGRTALVDWLDAARLDAATMGETLDAI